jgi:hypothetical protein
MAIHVRVAAPAIVDPSILPNSHLGLKKAAAATFWPLLLMSAQRGYGLLGPAPFVKA